MTKRQIFLKRIFDVFFSTLVLFCFSPIIILAIIVASIDTKAWGIFSQIRVGRHGKLFRIYKVRTMRINPLIQTNVTTRNDPRITKIGCFLRKMKIDELPQLLNVFLGHMSLVGPRPDVPGFLDCLTGEDKVLLTIRPGITGPATLRYRDEELVLQRQNNPGQYNREVIFPEKVRINKEYIRTYRFGKDLYYIWKTIFS